MKAVLKEVGWSRRERRPAKFARVAVALALLPFAFLLLPSRASAQTPAAGGGEVVDRMVAVVNGAELITYSDLLWQLALQPGAPLDSPRREDLRRALELLIDQRLVAQEAAKLPHVHATEQESKDAEAALIKLFPSLEEFQRRLERVGLTAAQLREIIHDRIDMEKYLDFRFRSFTVVTPQEVEAYYRDVFIPRRRRQAPGAIVPELKDIYEQMQAELIERRVESETDAFLEDARTSAQITFLDESLADGLGRPDAPGAGRGSASPPSRGATPRTHN